jgi:undecaprenyl-diphosphatase
MLFAALAIAAATGVMAPWDEFARKLVHDWSSECATTLAFGITRLSSIAVIAACSLIVRAGLCLVGPVRTAVGMMLFMACAVGLENAFKYLLHRTRPQAFFGASPATFSLPSGHALLSLCFYGSLGGLLAAPLGTRARAAIFTLLALLVIGIGLSRVYLGVHYLSDVVAGYFLASFWIAVFWSWWGSEGPRRK